MDVATLVKGKEIQAQITHAKEQIRKAQYTQRTDVVLRESYLHFNGIQDSLEVPSGLFRTIGMLVLSEYQQRLIELNQAFEAL